MKPFRFLQTLLTVLPVFTAGLYLLGLSYHQGYLEAFGVDDSLFPLAGDRALFTGFFSLVFLAFPSAVYAVLAIGAFAIMVVATAILSSTERVRTIALSIKSWLKSFFAKHVRKIKFSAEALSSSRAEAILDKSAIVYWYFGGSLIILLLVFLMVIFSVRSGESVGKDQILKYKNGRGTTAQVFSPQFPQGFAGILVTCSSTHCAIWSESRTLVIRHEAIDLIEMKTESMRKPPSAPKKPGTAP